MTCSKCGYENREHEGGTVLLVFDELKVEAIRHFLNGGMHDLPCIACGHRLDVTPTLVYVRGRSGHAWVVPGKPFFSAEMIASFDRDVRLEVLPDDAALRGRIIADLKEQAAKLIAALQEETIAGSWETLPARVFVSAVLANTVPGFSLHGFADGEPMPPEQLQAMLGDLQAQVWLQLLDAWTRDNARVLEDDLRSHFARDVIVGDAVRRIMPVVDHAIEVSGRHNAQRHYVFHAFRAALCAAARLENERAADWAAMYLLMEARDGGLEPRLRIADERVKETIPYLAACEAVRALLELSEEKLVDYKALAAAANKIHPDLIAEVLGKMSIIVRWIRAGDIESLDAVAGKLLAMYDAVPAGRAAVLSWFGNVCRQLRQPKRFFARAGDEPSWENDLPAEDLVPLWTERSTHHRFLGDLDAALYFIQEVIRRMPPDWPERGRRVALRNEAIILRDRGGIDEAIPRLDKLVQATEGEERIEMLNSLATSYMLFGRYDEALGACDEIVALAKGPFADHQPLARAARAMMLALAGRHAEALGELRVMGDQFTDLTTLTAVAAAWANAEITEADLDAFRAVVEKVDDAAAEAEQAGDIIGCLDALRVVAHIAARFRVEQAEARHDRAIAVANQYGQPIDPALLATKALLAIERQDFGEGRRVMLMMPEATAAWTGSSNDIVGVSIGRRHALKGPLEELAKQIIASEDAVDGRLIAELSRDVVGRSRQMRQRPSAEATERLLAALSGRSLASLRTPGRSTVVIEFLQHDSRVRPLATIIDQDGTASVAWLDPPPVSLEATGKKVWQRTRHWLPTDAFAYFPPWRKLEAWLRGVLDRIAPPDAHLIFIDHESHYGLPWHIAARSHTVSYARSWSSLLLYDPQPASPPPRIGVVRVPRHDDSETLREMLSQSAMRTAEWAARRGLPFMTVEPEQADRAAVQQIMEEATHVKLLCHGVVVPQEHEVALAIASDGELPPPEKLAMMDTYPLRAFRLGWRQFEKFERTPAVVFSAACSSGISHAAGLGERVGLWAGLQHAGTRTLVAPRWPVYPGQGKVLDILDRVLELMIGDHLGAAAAVRQASTEFSTHLKTSLAWCLAVEGEWR